MTDITTWKAALALPVSPRRDHIRGAVDAPLVLVEYGDYECCYCAAAHHVVAAIERQLADQLAFVFRHFPLVTLHHYAETAAEAAEAAGAQGKFWPMDDLLYQNQQRLAPPDLIAYAGALGLDIGRFNAELARNIHAIKVREDFLSGARSGVNGTPAFFINGVRHEGAWDFASLLAALKRSAGVALET